MRRVVLCLVASACTTSSSIGTITVSAYSNASPGTEDHTVQPQPIVGLTVFEEGGESGTTDASGQAVIEVSHDPATIHVAGSNGLTTIIGVPVNGIIRFGDAPYFPHVGLIDFTQPDIGATSYGLYAPGCLSIEPSATPNFVAEVSGSCVSMTVRVYAEAVTGTGTKISEQDVPVISNDHVTLGNYVDATSYALVPTNLPALAAPVTIAVGAVDPTTQMPIMLPTTDGPADADLVELTSGDDGASSTLLVRGPITSGPFDASHMLPVPSLDIVDATHAEWSIAASNASPNLIALYTRYTSFGWLVYAPPQVTSVTFPVLPSALAGDAPQGDATSSSLAYYEFRNSVLTLDDSQGPTISSQPIATSRVAF